MRDGKLQFLEDMIVSDEFGIIMMAWEHPLMKRHAEIVCQNGGDILEIGFGMGISAQYIQEYDIDSHTIIEIHPEIAEKAREWAEDKDNIEINRARGAGGARARPRCPYGLLRFRELRVAGSSMTLQTTTIPGAIFT